MAGEPRQPECRLQPARLADEVRKQAAHHRQPENGLAVTTSDRHRLLHGPYLAPRLRKGDRAFCIYRDADVVVTSWTDARIPWPRCRALHCRGGSGLLVTDE
jgi:hypothetical protein